MMKVVLPLLAILALAGCGVDGAPAAQNASAPVGLSVSGCVSAGVIKGSPDDLDLLNC